MASSAAQATTHADVGGVRTTHQVSVELARPDTFNKVVTDAVSRQKPTVVMVIPGDVSSGWLHQDADLVPGDLVRGTAAGLHCVSRYSTTGPPLHYFLVDFGISSWPRLP